MTEEERATFNGLVGEVSVLRIVLLDLFRHIHGDGAETRLVSLFDESFPAIPAGDPEEIEKLTAHSTAAKRFLNDIRVF